ncbi:MAG: hypothetical protein JXR37_27475 [Kiritimatiellae bacterium]|nr:hypothetical protein [Kiritimatiellia bacterium]
MPEAEPSTRWARLKRRAQKWPPVRAAIGAWFYLTERERWALFVVLALALLGVVARYWHLRRSESEPYQPAGLPAESDSLRADADGRR